MKKVNVFCGVEEKQKHIEPIAVKIPRRSTVTIEGVTFRYDLSQLHKKKLAKKGNIFLTIEMPFLSVVFSGTSQIETRVTENPTLFLSACKQMLQRIIKANPVLEAVLPEST